MDLELYFHELSRFCEQRYELAIGHTFLILFSKSSLSLSVLACLFAQCCSNLKIVECKYFARVSRATVSNLGLVQGLNARRVPQISSKATLLSTARPVQRIAARLPAPHHIKTANAKLASSSKRTDSGNLLEKEVPPFFLSCLMFVGVWRRSILAGVLETARANLECQKERSFVHAALTLPA